MQRVKGNNRTKQLQYSSLPMVPAEQLATLRILDANYNRASEGLRVVEDYCRFALSDRGLAERCKQLRHALAAAMAELPEWQRLAARDAAADVGAQITTPAERRRASLAAVAGASWGRIEQALRAIEEYAKLLSPRLAEEAKRLRYDSYTLAKATATTSQGQERLHAARLYVLVDGDGTYEALETLAASLVQAGVDILQLRNKQLADRELLKRARILRSVTAGTKTLFIMNDRPDLALLSQADGVHVGQEELSVAEVRRVVGPDLLVGVSTHDISQARQAVLEGASYLGCGPTFPSATKRFAAFPGLAFLREVADEISLPAFAIGGITAENLADVLATGFTRVAASGAILGAPSPSLAAATFLNRLTLTPKG
jgi:thiamine-phosphate pyrophosphorylase